MEDTKQNLLRIKPLIFTGLAILIQLIAIFLLFIKYEESLNLTSPIWILISALFIIYLINSDLESTYKMTWILIAAILPIFGFFLYIFLGLIPGKRTVNSLLTKNILDSKIHNLQSEETLSNLSEKNLGISKYLYEYAAAPTFSNTSTKYYPLGENLFTDLLKDLRSAEKFIFMEYFIVSPGKVWSEIEEILIEKAKSGVEVNFLYDGTNSFKLPDDFFKNLKDAGANIKEFFPISAFLTTSHNNRDHRKITVIDNRVAYTGGVNLADEYANIITRFGHWKDGGIRLEGEAVKSLTITFLQIWNMPEKLLNYEDYTKNTHSVENSSVVIPYSDQPNDNESVGENVYVDILNRANRYVYIMTPYLIISEKLNSAIRLCAKRGVDVRLVLPHIADKDIPLSIARTYYPELIRSGVKIYEYTPGFVHSKIFLADDEVTVIGSINLDFRSLYLHYENAVLCFDEKLAKDVLLDFNEVFEVSTKMSIPKYNELPLRYRFKGRCLRPFAPLL